MVKFWLQSTELLKLVQIMKPFILMREILLDQFIVLIQIISAKILSVNVKIIVQAMDTVSMAFVNVIQDFLE